VRKDSEIWVFGDHRNYPQDRLTLQVLGQAQRLSGEKGGVTVILLGHQLEEITKEYIARGAQCILLLDHPQLAFYRTDLFTTLVSDLIQEYKPKVFLLGASEFGKELAARIAKRLGIGLCAECISFDWDDQGEKLIASSSAFGGNFLARIVWNTNRPYMATVSPGTFTEPPYDRAAHGEIVRIEKNLNGGSSRIHVISSLREPHQTTKLEPGAPECRRIQRHQRIGNAFGGRGGSDPAGCGCPLDLTRSVDRTDR
jgi:electron transfer flavoprotein alpha subunit